MEIRTCEEYVLAELDTTKKELELLQKEATELTNHVSILVDAIRKVKKALDIEIVDAGEGKMYIRVWKSAVWNDSKPEEYATIKALFELEEPKDDRTEDNSENDSRTSE